MLRAIWFLIKTTLLVAVIAWAVQHDGNVMFDWQGWRIETSLGFVVGVLLVLLAVYTILYRLWRAFVGVPGVYKRYHHARQREQGYRDVTSGLVAVAAGDARAARKFARRAQQRIADAPLARLLMAQSCQLSGETSQARQEFAALLEDESAAFFGIKGLLQEALAAGDVKQAVEYMRQADDMQPGRDWILRTLFDLEVRNREWLRAEKILYRAERKGVFLSETVRRHRQALLLARADESFAVGDVVMAHRLAKRAFRLDMAFIPASTRLIRFYEHVGKRKSAFTTIEKAFAVAPHPELAERWAAFTPDVAEGVTLAEKNKAAYQWMQRLYRLNTAHPESLRMIGHAAIKAGEYDSARDYLMQAEDYRGLARLENMAGGDAAKIRTWMDMAADHPAETKWVCRSCGHTALDWTPLCRSCNAFNASVWGVPETETHRVQALPITAPVGASDVLTAPVLRTAAG